MGETEKGEAVMKRLSILVFAMAALAALVVSAAAAGGQKHNTALPTVTILVKSDAEHAKKGPDGKWHDAFLPAYPSVKAGRTTRLSFVNYDSGPHSMVAPGLNLNVTVPAAKGSVPGRVTVLLKAPAKAGRYDWWCGSPCDTWAMTHNGYMRGSIVVHA
jgi:plastocyanin